MAIEPRFSAQTSESILERMLDEISNEVDKRQGSVARDLTEPAAIELSGAYVAMDTLLTYAFMSEDMPSDLLTLAASDLGVDRKPATKAEGVVTFTGPENTLIPAGTQVRTDELIYFETDVDAIITSGQFSAEVFAMEGGISGNVGEFEVTTMVGPLAGIVEVINPFAFTGGVDEESDADLLARVHDKIRKPATSGNVYHYEQWAKEVPGVGDAIAIPIWNGPGTVKVVLLGADKKAPDTPIILDATAYIESQRPIGADVTVVGASELSINIQADLQLAPGANLAQVTEEIKAAIVEYLATLAFEDNLVRYTRIAYILQDVSRIIDYANLTVNGGTSNILTTSEQVAVVGTVTFDEL